MLQHWQQIYDPMANIWISSLIASIPIIFFFLALAVFRLKGSVAGTITVILALLVALFFYQMPVTMALSAAVYGFFYEGKIEFAADFFDGLLADKSNIGDYITVVTDGNGNAVIQVDRDGSAATHTMSDLLIVENQAGLSLQDLIDNENLRIKEGEDNADKIKKFSIENYIDSLYSIINSSC